MNGDDWSSTRAACYRGDSYGEDEFQLRVLEALAKANGPVDLETLGYAVYGRQKWPANWQAFHGRVCGLVSAVREKLRLALGLSGEWNPATCLERGNGGLWTLVVPPHAKSAG